MGRHSLSMDTSGLVGIYQNQCLVRKFLHVRVNNFDLAITVIGLLNSGFHFLDIALEREVEGDLILGDMGQVGHLVSSE